MTTRAPLIIPPALGPLVEQKRWVGWRWVTGKNGKLTKPPFRADDPRKHASSTDPATWCDLATCMRAYVESKVDGIGFALLNNNIAAVDIDDCRDAQTGKLHPWAEDVVARSGSYAEVTPSNEGIRIIGLASGGKLHRKFVAVVDGVSCELYRVAERYITITGQQIGSAAELAGIDQLLEGLFEELKARKTGTSKKRTNGAATNSGGGKHDLDSLIKNGCGEDFGGDRSRATWYVIHQLLKQGKTDDEIVTVLLNAANGISAHTLDQSNPEAYARKQVDKARQSGTDTDAELERLAKLSLVEYEQQRKEAAERLNVRASILDRLVQAEREKLGLMEDDGRQGRTISLPEPEPWPTPVDGAALLDEIAEAIGRYVIMSDHARSATALWAVHTFLLDCFGITPRLAVRSPMKRCGKTTLLDVLSRLVLRPLPTGSVTAAALFRVVEGYRPTLLVDEADTFLAEADELRGVLNSGHRKGGQVVRTVGDDHEPRAFSTFAAVAIAIIGNLPDTLADRSVITDLKRRMPSEEVTSFRFDRGAHLDVLARQAARWAQDHAGTIAAADPKMPGIYNREADNWAPLFAIADVAGGGWPERARAAAAASHIVAGDDEASRTELLLGDIRGAFGERAEIASAELVEALVGIEGHPWAEMGRNRKPMTQSRLARMLKPLSIGPGKVGPETARKNGYLRQHFKEAFDRYLGDTKVDSRTECDEMGTSELFKVDSESDGCPLSNPEKPNNDGLLSTCPLSKGETGEKSASSPFNGGAERSPDSQPGLSRRRVDELAAWYQDRAYGQYQEHGDVSSADLDAGLRMVLAEEVLPEFVETEFQRIMVVVFRV